jgi:hypothetical protein
VEARRRKKNFKSHAHDKCASIVGGVQDVMWVIACATTFSKVDDFLFDVFIDVWFYGVFKEDLVIRVVLFNSWLHGSKPEAAVARLNTMLPTIWL